MGFPEPHTKPQCDMMMNVFPMQPVDGTPPGKTSKLPTLCQRMQHQERQSNPNRPAPVRENPREELDRNNTLRHHGYVFPPVRDRYHYHRCRELQEQ